MTLLPLISPELDAIMKSSQSEDVVDIFILLKPSPRVIIQRSLFDDHWIELDNRVKSSMLAEAVSVIQKPLIDELRKLGITTYKTIWINNVLQIKAKLTLLKTFLSTAFPTDIRVDSISHNFEFNAHVTNDHSLAVSATKDCIMEPVPFYPGWNLDAIGSNILNERPFNLTGKGVIVSVIDRGIDYAHPDLKKQMWQGGLKYPKHGFNFGNDTVETMDTDGHGTVCASVVAGNGTAGTKTGVAPKATLMALKIYDDKGYSTQVKMWQAMMFSLEHQCDIISMSQSCPKEKSPNRNAWRAACDTIKCLNVFHVNSAGNNGCTKKTLELEVPTNLNPPGDCPPPWLHPLQVIRHKGLTSSCITSGATNAARQWWIDSSYGPTSWKDFEYTQGKKSGLIKPDLCAPGVDIYGCAVTPSGSDLPPEAYYTYGTGTSMAVPHVAGAAALLLEALRRKTKHKHRLIEKLFVALSMTCKKIEGQKKSKEDKYGSGEINVYQAWVFGCRQAWW